VNTLLFTPALCRLGLTLLHALWELALLGGVAWIGLALQRRNRPQTRYLWACACLLLMGAAPLVTYLLLGPSTVPGTAALARGMDPGAVVTVTVVTGTRAPLGLAPLLPWIALLWCLGSTSMLARLGGGMLWLDRVYLRDASEAPEPLSRMLAHLAGRLGVPPGVRLKVSPRADTPMVLGWLRPVILLPSAALLGLSPAALEAILAHELAHVRRHDFLANVLQSILEALLFFHPAAWWLSRQIRELREHCCDDAAVALSGDPAPLTEGLAALARLRTLPEPAIEPALAAARGSLMSRLQRLFRPHDMPIPSLRGLALTLLATLSTGTLVLVAQTHPKPKEPPVPGPLPRGVATPRANLPSPLQSAAAPTRERAPWPAGPVLEGTAPLPAPAPWVVPGPTAPLIPETLPSPRSEPSPPQAPRSQEIPQRSSAVSKVQTVRVLHRPPPPAYPAEALAARVEGTVEVIVAIGQSGLPVMATATSGPIPLRAAAEAYALGWRFEPASQDGQRVGSLFRLAVPFRLNEVGVPPVDAQPLQVDPQTMAADSAFQMPKILQRGSIPTFPRIASIAKVDGPVTVDMTIGVDGVPSDIVATGPRYLLSSSEKYAKGFRFQPGTYQGIPVRCRFRMVVSYRGPH
jgi:beta-lactamase regulating signal transducer with metallopeptidase domain/outer membrane biosynthesis protein TonB